MFPVGALQMNTDHKPKPAGSDKPEEDRQMDDNIDDLGRKPDGSRVDQPGATKPSRRN